MVRMFGYILAILVIGFLAYVRLAPSDPARWHVSVTAKANETMAGGAIRVVPNKDGAWDALNIALAGFERTHLLAGSVEQGHVTYVTRSKLIGFPDYTTLEKSGDSIKLYARLRFGSSDMGVNAARLDALVKLLN